MELAAKNHQHCTRQRHPAQPSALTQHCPAPPILQNWNSKAAPTFRTLHPFGTVKSMDLGMECWTPLQISAPDFRSELNWRCIAWPEVEKTCARGNEHRPRAFRSKLSISTVRGKSNRYFRGQPFVLELPTQTPGGMSSPKATPIGTCAGIQRTCHPNLKISV